jgi:hypothetical protein
MKIECSIKKILFFLVVCFVTINIIFLIVVIADKMNNSESQIISEEQKQRKIIDFLKANIDFNNTYELKNDQLHFFYSTININNPPN